MNCREVEEQEILERYLTGPLTDPERDEFEQHYFECDSCFSRLQAGLAVQQELQQHPQIEIQARGASLRRMWSWTPAFAAVALLLATGIWWYAGRREQSAQQATSSTPITKPQPSPQTQQPSTTAPSLEELAKVDPPPYSAILLRGAEDEAHESFRQAMQQYSKNDYAGAIPGLRAAVKGSPGMASLRFYLGACYLLTDQPDSAIDSFRKTVSLSDPAYSELAHFYLAKAYLRKKDVSAAKEELQATVRLNGSEAAAAGEILRQLGK